MSCSDCAFSIHPNQQPNTTHSCHMHPCLHASMHPCLHASMQLSAFCHGHSCELGQQQVFTKTISQHNNNTLLPTMQQLQWLCKPTNTSIDTIVLYTTHCSHCMHHRHHEHFKTQCHQDNSHFHPTYCCQQCNNYNNYNGFGHQPAP